MICFRDHKLRFHCGRVLEKVNIPISKLLSLAKSEHSLRHCWDFFWNSRGGTLQRVCWKFAFLKGSPFTPIYSFLDSNMSHPILMFIWYLHTFTYFNNVPFMSILCLLKNCKKSILDKVCENAIKSPELKESNILFFWASRTVNEKYFFLLNHNMIKWRLASQICSDLHVSHKEDDKSE